MMRDSYRGELQVIGLMLIGLVLVINLTASQSAELLGAAAGLGFAAAVLYLLPLIRTAWASARRQYEAFLAAPIPLTVNDMVEMAWETVEKNGFHDADVAKLTPEHSQAQIAALAPIVLALAQVVEAVRKPAEHNVGRALVDLSGHVQATAEQGLAVRALVTSADSPWDQLGGSRTQIICRLILIISEAAEAIEAVLKGDWQEFGFENADMMLRIGDMIKAYNLVAADMGRPPINLETMIRGKNGRNKRRGRMHGGKTA